MTSAPPAVLAVLTEAIARGVTPGAVVEAGGASGAAWQAAAGRLTFAPNAPPVGPDTVYDLASLTKVVATTTLAMEAHANGTLPLDALVAERLAGRPADGATVRDLLEHAAGFPAHRPYYLEVAGRRGYVSRLATEPVTGPPRTRSEYTDLGFMVLGVLLEAANDATLDELFARFVAEALGPVDLAYGARSAWTGRIAPTSIDPWRGRVIAGRVHDGNAAALGGVAGHAGLFGTALALGTFARWCLGLQLGTGTPWRNVTTPIARAFAAPSAVPGSSRALGWDTMRPTSSCGTGLSPRALGHTGFTGTSLWLDPDRDLYVVVLTNRVHPSSDREGIQGLRIAIHEAIAETWARP